MPKKVKKLEVGQEIETQCTKCKTEMIHVITAIKDDKISKVMCKGCLTTHKYHAASVTKRGRGRPRKTDKSPSKPAKRRGRKKDWPTLVSKIEESEIVDYSISEDFSDISAIRHKKFGVGVITKILADNKIEVVFQEDKKILAQNWKEF
ncbi:MAG: hypothetical protein ACE5HI_04320 [bacterium]